MNFLNSQKPYSSQKKGEAKPKKALININPHNISRTDKVAAEKDKKGKNLGENKSKNQWVVAEEEMRANNGPEDPSLASQSLANENKFVPVTNSDPVVGSEQPKISQEPKNTENLSEKLPEKKEPEDKGYQEPLEELATRNNERRPKDNYHNKKPYKNQGNQGNWGQGYPKRNNYRDGNGYNDDYYDDYEHNEGYGHQRGQNNRKDNQHYQPKKNYETQERVIYVKKN